MSSRLDYQIKVDATNQRAAVTFVNHDKQKLTTLHMSLDSARELFRDKPHILRFIEKKATGEIEPGEVAQAIRQVSGGTT